MTERIVLYLSASITNARANLRLRDHLPAARFELVLPQEFTPLERSHPTYPRAIYERCIGEMERCDAAVLLLDAFGVDCASEAGWICARGKPLIGIATGSLRFLQHWMVKGNLTAVLCTDPLALDAVTEDPILRHADVRALPSWDDLGSLVADIIARDGAGTQAARRAAHGGTR